MMGNYDDRMAFRSIFPGALNDGHGFVHGSLSLHGHQLLFHDTKQDVTHPGSGGTLIPEVSALAAAIHACVGRINHRSFGEPGAALFQTGCERLGIAPQDAVMIGDNPMTDAIGARRIGMRFMQVEPNEPRQP